MLSDEFIERALNDWRRHRISLHEAVRAVAEAAVKAEREPASDGSDYKTKLVFTKHDMDREAARLGALIELHMDDSTKLLKMLGVCNDTKENDHWRYRKVCFVDFDKVSAVKAEREGEKPFGWYTEDYDTDKSATTYDAGVRDRWVAKGWPVFPLYTTPPAAPVPEQASAAVPDGFVLVPVDPTYEMKKQGIYVEIDHDGVILCMSFEDVSRIYRAMLAASQPETN